MFKDNLLSWHIAGLQAFKSAVDQGIPYAQKAKSAAKNEQLEVAATVLETILTTQSATIVGFLLEAQAEVNFTQDVIMEGILIGQDLMVEAGKDLETVDFAYLSGGKVAMNYYMNAFISHAELAEKLGLLAQAAGLKKMGFEHQEMLNQYTKIIETDFYPKLTAKG